MDFTTKCVVGMIGLPNRGKTYMSRKLARYLSWLGHDACVFNVTQYRAELMAKNTDPNTAEDFFDYEKYNTGAAIEATGDLATYINGSGSIAIYDGLNITRAERIEFESQLEKQITCDYNLIWVESF